MALVITIAIGKGGVGKTATTVNLAAAMALDGKRVLVVDTDIQANSTFSLTGQKLKENLFTNKSLFDMIRAYGIVHPSNYITKTQYENIDMIVSNLSTPLIDTQLSTLASLTNKKETSFLFDCLYEIADDYDYILIDTPPAHDNVRVQSALLASDYVIIPIMYEEYCLDLMESTFAVIGKLEKENDTEIKILGVLPTIVERTLLTTLYKEILQDSPYSGYFFNTEIRKGNAVKESNSQAKPCIFYSKNANPSIDYLNLYEEIKERIAKDEGEQ